MTMASKQLHQGLLAIVIVCQTCGIGLMGQGEYYIELGSNIGGYAMEILCRTNASAILFEPGPIALFRLSSSVARLAQVRPEPAHPPSSSLPRVLVPQLPMLARYVTT